MSSIEIGTPFRSFPLMASPPLTMVGGFQGTEGGSTQLQITESKICEQTPIIYVLQPNTTTAPTHMCKLVDTLYNG